MEFMCMSQAMIEFSCILLLHTSKGLILIQVRVFMYGIARGGISLID